MTTTTHERARSLRLAAAGTVVAALLLTACRGPDAPPAAASAGSGASAHAEEAGEHRGAELKLSDDEARRAGIEVETLAPRTVAGSITVTATIHANQDRIARIAPRVEGRVLTVAARLGDVVRPGQVLAVLDSLAIGEAQSAGLQAEASHRVALADLARVEVLAADEIVPRRDLLRARADAEKASAELRATRDRLRLLGGARSHGRADSTFALTAPMAGTVIEKKATVGQLGAPSDALFVVADLSTLWIEADLTEDVLAKVQVGAAASVTVAAYPGERFAGRVAYVASILDKDTRTVPARIEVASQGGRLKPGMFASATIATGGTMREELSVPDAAVLLVQGQPTVFVQERGGFEARAIEPGEKVAGRTVIRSGLQAGERVVTARAFALKARLLKSQISDEH